MRAWAVDGDGQDVTEVLKFHEVRVCTDADRGSYLDPDPAIPGLRVYAEHEGVEYLLYASEGAPG